MKASSRRVTLVVLGLLGAACGPGCGQGLDVGSDVIWSSRFEGDAGLSEWTKAWPKSWNGVDGGMGGMGGDPGTGVAAGSVSNMTASSGIAVSAVQSHTGSHAAQLQIGMTDQQQINCSLTRTGTTLPKRAYYSAWYFLPQRYSVGPGGFWLLMKFRRRDANGTQHELYDLGLKDSGTDMTLHLYNWDKGTNEGSLDALNRKVPIGTWFQLEAYYCYAPECNSLTDPAFSLSIDGAKILDIPSRTTEVTSWVAWEISNIGLSLTDPNKTPPTSATVTLFADDAAISLKPVGPTGQLP